MSEQVTHSSDSFSPPLGLLCSLACCALALYVNIVEIVEIALHITFGVVYINNAISLMISCISHAKKFLHRNRFWNVKVLS